MWAEQKAEEGNVVEEMAMVRNGRRFHRKVGDAAVLTRNDDIELAPEHLVSG